MKNHAETEARIKRLVESLSVASETSAKYVMEQIDELHRQSEQEQTRIAELEKLARQSNALSQNLFFYRDMIESFADTVDSTTIEERRRLLRTIVKKSGLGRQKRLCIPLCGGWRAEFAAHRAAYVSVRRG